MSETDIEYWKKRNPDEKKILLELQRLQEENRKLKINRFYDICKLIIVFCATVCAICVTAALVYITFK